jgi:3-hydroxybutyryl-CoA dehydrogenase
MSQQAAIAVIGAGTMGLGIAQVAASAGQNVVLIDMNSEALARARATINSALDASVEKGRLEPASRNAIEARIRSSSSIEDAAGCSLVVEAIVEKIDAKQALFSALEAIVAKDAILASNTSSLSIAEIAGPLRSPGRFLGLHFFNPVPAMRLVEVIAGPKTDSDLLDRAVTLMRAWGKHPVLVADVPGFIVNRVARPYYAEAFAALADGVAPADIDCAMVQSGGFRMGPLTLSDLIGQDINYTVAVSLFEAYGGVTRFRPQRRQKALVDAGALGRKTGAGVYDYAHTLPTPGLADAAPRPASVSTGAGDALLERLCIDAGFSPVEAPGIGAIVADEIVIARCDGRTLAQRADVDVLIDAVRNIDNAPTLIIAARSEESAMIAAGFIQAGGREVLIVPDRPGMLVLRTLAQLANAAADAVADAVGDPDAIDAALLYGAGHPEGPLSWARRTGLDNVATALSNIATGLDDRMYEPSKWLLAEANSHAS